MRVLVTGGAGYIGSVTADLLISRGHDVVVVDDLSNGYREAVPAAAAFARVDILDGDALRAVLARHPVDAAVHFAAEAFIPVAVRDPGRAWRQNLEGTRSLCDALVHSGVRRFVFSSTCSVYGSPTALPITEETPPAPINPYGASKLAGEMLLAGFEAAYGLRWVALRYFNVCGATDERGADRPEEVQLIPIALDVARGTRPELVVHGSDYATPDGTCIRDYIHVHDIAAANLAALEQVEALPQRVYNVGVGRGFSVLEVIRAVERVCGHAIPWRFGPRREGDPAHLYADASAFARDAGFRAQCTDLDVMVSDALAWRERFPSGYGA